MVDKVPQTRDEKVENLITNYSMIFMGVFEEAFSELADKIAAVMSKGMAAASGSPPEAMPSGSASPEAAGMGRKPDDQMTLEVRMQIEDLLAGMREELASQRPTNPDLFKQYISSPAFDRGVEIVERYDFGRPKLTEKLGDDVLVSYVFILMSGDKGLSRMFKELGDWQEGLAEAPWSR